MTYKHITLFIFVLIIGACSSIPSFIGGNGASTQESAKEETSTALEQSEHEDAITQKAAPLSDSEQLALALLSQSDLYQSSKRELAPGAKSKVIRALNEFQQGEFAQSEKSMTAILGNELNLNSTVYVLAGDISLANNKHQDAIEHYRSALKLNEYDAKAANRLAMQLRQQGDFEQALALYTQAIKSQPSHAHSYRNRAVLYDLYINEKAKALQDYQAYFAILNYQLTAHSAKASQISEQTSNEASIVAISESQLKETKRNVKLVQRWIADVTRQVAAIERANSNASAGGK